MTTGATCRILGKAKIHLTQLSFSDSAACWYLGSLQKKWKTQWKVFVDTGCFICIQALNFIHIWPQENLLQVGIQDPSKDDKILTIRTLLTQPILSVSTHSISTTFDHRSHPQEFRRSVVTPNTTLTLRLCWKSLFGVCQKILKYLMEGLNQQRMFCVQA